jgi:hypothetical protein
MWKVIKDWFTPTNVKHPYYPFRVVEHTYGNGKVVYCIEEHCNTWGGDYDWQVKACDFLRQCEACKYAQEQQRIRLSYTITSTKVVSCD